MHARGVLGVAVWPASIVVTQLDASGQGSGAADHAFLKLLVGCYVVGIREAHRLDSLVSENAYHYCGFMPTGPGAARRFRASWTTDMLVVRRSSVTGQESLGPAPDGYVRRALVVERLMVPVAPS